MTPSPDPGSSGGPHAAGLTAEAAAARLARLPARGMMRRLVFAVAIAFFFDLADQSALGFVAPALMKSLGFGLDTVALVVSVTFVGLLLGASVGGNLSDRFGRKRIVVASLGVASAGSLVQSLIQGLPDMLVLRLVSATGMGALFVVALTYLVEMSPVQQRGARMALAYIVGTLGSAILAIAARIVIPLGPEGWRLVFVICGLGLVVLLLFRGLPESPLWLLTRGRVADAEAALSRFEMGVERASGPLPEPVIIPMIDRLDDAGRPADATSAKDRSWRDLFRGSLVRSTALLMVIWVLFTMLSQTFASWLPTILSLRGFDPQTLLTITAVAIFGAPAGAALAYFAASRFSRLVMLMITTLGAAVSGAVFGIATAVGVVMAAAFAQFLLIGWFSPMLSATMAEKFPTDLRATGSGIAFSSGRLANIVAPFTFAAALSALGYGVVGWFLLVGWILVAIAIIALRPGGVHGAPSSRGGAAPIATADTGEETGSETELVSGDVER